MKNPFSVDVVPEEQLKRNAVSLSYDNFFTANFGQLMPAFVQEVIPGDTINIKKGTVIGIRGMPTVFPVQTKIRAGIEFYYVRNRCLMDNWEDFIFKTKDIEQCWLKLDSARAKSMISTGSLGDMFGVPTTIGHDGFVSKEIPVSAPSRFGSNLYFSPYDSSYHNFFTSVDDLISFITNNSLSSLPPVINDDLSSSLFMAQSFTLPSKLQEESDLIFTIGDNFAGTVAYGNTYFISIIKNNVFQKVYRVYIENKPTDLNHLYITYDYNSECIKDIISYSGDSDVKFLLCFARYIPTEDSLYYLDLSNYPLFASSDNIFITSLTVPLYNSIVVDATSDDYVSSNPFVGNNPDIRLNALPFRAYEMICNYYYRNDKNNPYVLNGEAQYNKFLPSTATGGDTNTYDFHYRNWELDKFTSAVQSPQFGEAPLVGLTYNPLAESAVFTFDVTDSQGHSTEVNATLGVDARGNLSNIADFSDSIPSANLRKLQEMVNYGISINDLRVTNSFQRFKENMLRKGLRYRNQLKSHLGVSVDYPDIDVPQYIGGFNGDIVAGQVTNFADSPNAGLGDYVGTLNGGIECTRDITHYCVEHGFIIGIFSFAPSPAYPQSTKNVMLKTDAFDYFQDEFSKIGFVPIHYSEVFPLQTPYGKNIDDVFGYQKNNYDYLQNVDEIHGDFRTSLKDFVCSRTFASRPELSESFVKVKPEQLNDIFVTQNIADAYGSNAKFMVACRFIVDAARQVPVFGSPSLE